MVYPYDDKNMVYSKLKRQYILTKDAIENNLFLDEEIMEYLKTSKNLRAFLEEVSEDIYNFIYKYTLNSQIPVKEWQLAKVPEYRQVLQRALLAQARYGLRSGGMGIKDQSGMDFDRLKSFSQQDVRGSRHIAPQSEEILGNAGLLYAGKLYLRIENLNDGTY